MASLRWIKTALAAAGAALLAAAAAFADPFTVSGVEIDAEASSAFEAQRQALAEGQTQAARVLINRLTLPEDRLEADLPPIDPDTAAQLIAGLSIADEQRSATRYRARIAVDFDPREVRAYFQSFDMPFVQSQAEPVLTVPVTADGRIAGTRWYETWAEGGFADALTPFVPVEVERGSDGRPADPPIDPRAALDLDMPSLEALADRYGYDAVAVIRAQGAPESGGVRASGEIVRFGPDGETVEQIATSAGPDFLSAASRIVERLEEEWKRQAVVRGGDTAEIEVTVLFDSLREWRELQGAVAGASLISNARLDALSRTGAVMTITHRGAREQVRAELSARGAVFAEDPDLGWTVRRR